MPPRDPARDLPWCDSVADWQATAASLGWPASAIAELEQEIARTLDPTARRGRTLTDCVGCALAVLHVAAEAMLVRDASGQIFGYGHPTRGRNQSGQHMADALGIPAFVKPVRVQSAPQSIEIRTTPMTEPQPLSSPEHERVARAKWGDGPSQIAWIDTETTGMAKTCQVIEVAVAITDMDGVILAPPVVELKAPAAVLIALEPWATLDDRAMDVHGIDWRTPEFTAAARPMRDVLTALFKRLAGRAVGGHYVAYDVGMLARNAERCGLATPPSLAAPTVDTCTIARRLKKLGLLDVPGCSLTELKDHFGIEHPAHRALGDVLATIETYRRLRALDQPALQLTGTT